MQAMVHIQKFATHKQLYVSCPNYMYPVQQLYVSWKNWLGTFQHQNLGFNNITFYLSWNHDQVFQNLMELL